MPRRRRQERSPRRKRRSSSTSRRRSYSRSNSGSSSSDNDSGSAEEEEEEEEEATVAEPASVLGRFHRVYVETVDVTQSEIAVEVLYHGRWLVNCIDLAMLKISSRTQT
jgi:predicted MarR family transcription regulator